MEAGPGGRGDCQPALGPESVGFETGRMLLETWLPISFIPSLALLCTPAVHLPPLQGFEITVVVEQKRKLRFSLGRERTTIKKAKEKDDALGRWCVLRTSEARCCAWWGLGAGLHYERGQRGPGGHIGTKSHVAV